MERIQNQEKCISSHFYSSMFILQKQDLVVEVHYGTQKKDIKTLVKKKKQWS